MRMGSSAMKRSGATISRRRSKHSSTKRRDRKNWIRNKKKARRTNRTKRRRNPAHSRPRVFSWRRSMSIDERPEASHVVAETVDGFEVTDPTLKPTPEAELAPEIPVESKIKVK